MQQAFIQATIKNGFNKIQDFDGDDANGLGPYPMNIVNGVRQNTGITYLSDEVRARNNLTILADKLVDHVIFDGKKAKGIRLANGEEISANEVVLSAGAYGSSAILLRPGIGSKQSSEKLNIPVVVDLPVGENLVDHPFYYNAYAADPTKIGKQIPVIGAKLWIKSSTSKNNELDLHITPHIYFRMS